MAIFALTGARIFTADGFLDDHAVVVNGDTIAGTAPAAVLPGAWRAQRLPAACWLRASSTHK
jgi:hypothetical protein